jgi:hypothetical protein
VKTFPAAPPSMKHARLLLGLLSVIILAGTLPTFGLLAGPRRLAYALDGESLVVEATIAGVSLGGGRWSRANLTDARVEVLSASPQRYRGTGLPEFCAGRWGLPDGREVRLATNCSLRVVVLTFGEETVVISPREPEAFVTALRSPVGELVDEADSAPLFGGLLTGLAALMFAVALGIPLALLVWLPRKIRDLAYTVRDGRLEVPAHFRSVSLRLSGCTARQGPLTGALRLGGTGLPGALYLGRFRGGGRFLHCAATNLKTGWLVEGEGAVYVTPADDAAFAAALREAGAKLG